MTFPASGCISYELRSQFDQEMRNGNDFNLLKDLHTKIKELECHLKTLEWNGQNEKHHFGFNDDSFRNTDDQRPLL